MTYFTKSEARAAAARTRASQKGIGMESADILLHSVNAATKEDKFDIFLSHSIADAAIVLGIKRLLEDDGLKVYVDWVQDKKLDRERVTKETAAILRQRMRQSTSLIYLCSENSTASKWMPWELGYFDGFNPDGVAVMPILDKSTDVFRGQEYLGLYPVVQKNTYTNGEPDVFVEDFGVRWATLKNFGSGRPGWQKYVG